METRRWSVSVVTIVGVFSLVSPAVVTIHPRASTKTCAQVNAYRRYDRTSLTAQIERTRIAYDIEEGLGRQGLRWGGEHRWESGERYTGGDYVHARDYGDQCGKPCLFCAGPTHARTPTHIYTYTRRRSEISPLCRFHSSPIASNRFGSEVSANWKVRWCFLFPACNRCRLSRSIPQNVLLETFDSDNQCFNHVFSLRTVLTATNCNSLEKISFSVKRNITSWKEDR